MIAKPGLIEEIQENMKEQTRLLTRICAALEEQNAARREAPPPIAKQFLGLAARMQKANGKDK